MKVDNHMSGASAREWRAVDGDSLPHALGLEGVANARDLGGYVMADGRKIKPGKLYRTAALSRATDSDLEKLAGLRLVIDLRTEDEMRVAPDRLPDGAETVHLDVAGKSLVAMRRAMGEEVARLGKDVRALPGIEQACVYAKTSAMQNYMRDMYTFLLTDEEARGKYARMFDEILARDGATVLWHCSQGKDRCGTAAVLVLFALGADRQTVMEDFALTNAYYRPILDQMLIYAGTQNLDDDTVNTLRTIGGVLPAYMERAIDAAEKQYGSMQQYLTNALGLTEEKRKRLQALYLEE
ncbi:MAG: tyrosine-protein phosphatase [Clostridia bacterium]|nr:tyrosine-protein phosphatase [Clostridia bacterium]